jgi:hypothetical protein
MARRFPIPESPFRQVAFPAALIALVFAALPGVVLFLLTLLGKESAANAWLEEHFQVSYHPSLARWASLLLLLVPPLIVLLYFLKLKRRPLQVPSTFLWRKSIEDLHVNSLFQWLRENILLVLQVLTVLLLIYSVLAFQLHGRLGESRHYILMIDNSASMAATDVAPSRLDVAKREALAEIDAHPDSDYGMIIVFNATAEILQSYTSNRDQLRRRVSEIAQTERLTRIDDALSLADSLANPNRPTDADSGKVPATATEGNPTRVHLYSDGGFPDVKEFARGNLNFEFHPIGERGPAGVDNVALVTLNAVRDERDASKVTVFARAMSYRSQASDIRVRLEVIVNDQPAGIYDKPLTLDARLEGAEGAVTFDLAEIDDRANVVLHAQLLDARGEKLQDYLTLDNEAWLVVGVVRKARVLVVAPHIPALRPVFKDDRDPVLRSFFNQPATLKVAEVTYLALEDLKDDDRYGKPARNGEYDLIIFEGRGPEKPEEMPRANTWFIDCLPPSLHAENATPKEFPRVRLGKHPLLQNVSPLQEMVVVKPLLYRMTDSDVPPHAPRLLETEGDTAILFALSRQSFTDLVMTFPFFNQEGEEMTKWYLQLDFPTFLRNVLYSLGNVSDAAGEELVRPGQPKTLRPSVAVEEISVHDPTGHSETVRRGSRADFIYGATERVGVYDVSWRGAKQRSFAVNLLDAGESNLRPRATFRLGSDEVTAGVVHAQPRELWKWVALAALFLLLLEWYIYNRRVTL